MITKALQHARENLVAYLALFIALGGTSYAAVNLPAGSVGSRQLRNHSISPIKFDPQFINGTTRAWVVAGPDGKILAGVGHPIIKIGTGGAGLYYVKWKKVARPTQRGCFAIGGVTGETGPGSAGALLFAPPKQPWDVAVNTYGPQGQQLAQSFYAAVIC